MDQQLTVTLQLRDGYNFDVGANRTAQRGLQACIQ
jgi:hypothetical protein